MNREINRDFEFIDDAYDYGMMDGEVMKKVERGEAVLEKLVLI
jgi:hypothetical protein